DEDATTDVMRPGRLARIEESYAGLRPQADDDRGPRRAVPSSRGAASGSPVSERTLRDQVAPLHHAPSPDPYDMPTRSDPNPRKLVERELELHRRRKGSR